MSGGRHSTYVRAIPVELVLGTAVNTREGPLEALAERVERIGEGQQFVNRLLVERGGGTPPLAPAPRSVTPH